jgi:pimeloyl-ACP methyl ester carboxylesterase
MKLDEHILDRPGCRLHSWLGGQADGPPVVFTHGATVDHHECDRTLPIVVCVDCTSNFQELTSMESLALRLAEPIFRLVPHRSLVEQALAATTASEASRDLLRPAMNRLSKDEFIRTWMEATACLHFEPNYAIAKPILLEVGDRDATRNIRKAMPRWAAREPEARLVVAPHVRHAPNLDDPDRFHKELVAFLDRHSGRPVGS